MSQLVETGQGVAEFPDEMSHDEIAGVIKKQFYSPENPPPAEIKPGTGAKAENVISGMDQAPLYPSKANADPLTVKIAGQDNEPFVSPQTMTAAGRASAAVGTGGLSELLLNAYPQSGVAKIAQGGLQAYGDILSGFTTPSNLGLLAVGGPAAKLGKMGTVLLSSAFEAQALRQAPEQWKQFRDAYDKGDYQTATRIGTDLLGGVTLPAAAIGVHAFAPKTLMEKLAPITGEARNQSSISDQISILEHDPSLQDSNAKTQELGSLKKMQVPQAPVEAVKPEEVTAKPETPTPPGEVTPQGQATPSEIAGEAKPVPEASQAPVESGLQAKPELPENTEVTIKASTSKGEPLEVKMDAREAEKVLNERKTALENLIDCLG